MTEEFPANMAMFSSESFTTSTPFHQQHDSGLYTPESRSLSQASVAENFRPNYFTLRKNLFGKRSFRENIPDDQFSQKHKLLLSRNTIFTRRDSSSNKETPRTSRSYVGSCKPTYFAKSETRQTPNLFSENAFVAFQQLNNNESGFFDYTPERSRNPKSESSEIPSFRKIEKLHQGKQNPKEESLEYLKHSLNVSGAKSNADLSISQLMHLYYIYRFQRMGLKPSSTDVDFYENNLQINEMNKEGELFLLSWKNRLECISADLEKEPKIDYLNQLNMMNLDSIINRILSYLSGRNLQSVSCVSQMWRKLVFADENANAARLCYLEEIQKFKQERENKLFNPFQRSPNFRILRSTENVQQKEQLQVKKTIKEINFDAFIEVGKSGNKHKSMKCPSCSCLSLQHKQIITKCICLFCGYEFCCNCLKPYSNWHLCAPAYPSATKPSVKSKRYLRRL